MGLCTIFFCSVLPDTRICDLRDEIESQLNDDGIIPNDFVFLKSVGSRVTRVTFLMFKIFICAKLEIIDYKSFSFIKRVYIQCSLSQRKKSS